MNSSEANRIAQHLNLSRQDQDLLSTRPVDFFSIHASNLPPQLSILFKSHTNPFTRSRIQTIKKRRINYANQTRPIQLTIDEARQRLPFLYSETLDLKDEDPSNASLGNHSIGRNSDREAMDKRLDHILDVVEEELVKERFQNQKEKHFESLPEVEDQDDVQVRDEEVKNLTLEQKEDLEYENMLEFERKVTFERSQSSS